MITAVDSSVLLDALVGNAAHSDASIRVLRRAAADGALIVSECVVAEVCPALGGDEMIEFLTDWELRFVPSSRESALLAGESFALYLKRGGSRDRVIPDFLIGAHAQCHADRLLARDRGYLRDYFKNLEVLVPA